MTLRRLALASTLPAVLAMTIALFGGAQACSSSSSEAPAASGTCGGDPFATAGLDTVKITKAEACARFVAALQKKADSIKPAPCDLKPVPKCPDVLDKFEADTRAIHPGLCIDGYSNGALTNCECRISTYTTCHDFEAKGCILGIIPKPGGATCESDAGTDSGSDAFDTSPMDDAPAADAADAGGGG